MLFSTFSFVAIFLPLVVLGFFSCHKYLGNNAPKIFLLFASLFFYASWNPIYLPLLLGSILCNFIISNKIRTKKSKTLLWVGVSFNLLLLGYFKYMNFLMENVSSLFGNDWASLNILLPLGISFFTFQQIAYILDSYKGKTGTHTFLDYSLFVSFFPQLIAGPIVHWREVMPQFDNLNEQKFNSDNFLKGLNIFILGFLKKVLIADNLAVVTNIIFNDTTTLDMTSSWLGGICFMFQIYFDFSAYSEMAIGSALMMNIRLPINFNSPYKARNINDFWSRWHITLTRWFFQYTFLPLTSLWASKHNLQSGLSLGVLSRVTLIIFLLSGLWHGAEWTFVIWGLMHGLALVTFRFWQASKISINALLSKSITIVFLIFAAVVFRSNDMQSLEDFIFAMIGGHGIYHPDNFISENILFISIAFIVPTYIIYFMPNTLEIVGYENIKQDSKEHYIAPFIKVKTRFMSMESNMYISIVYAIIFSLSVINVMTADSPDAFIYFDF